MWVLHKLDLQGKTDKNWQDYHKEYIDIWDRRMKFLPIREPFFLIEHDGLFGVNTLVKSPQQTISAIDGDKE